MFELIKGFGKYCGDGETFHPDAEKLAFQISADDLRETLEKTKDEEGKQILSRHTISLFFRDLTFAAKIEAMSKLAQLDANREDLRKLKAKLEEPCFHHATICATCWEAIWKEVTNG